MASGSEKDYWCRTTFGDGVKTSFTWTIENFKNRKEKFNQPILSSIISVTDSSDKRLTKWCIEVYPKGSLTVNRMQYANVGVFLRNKNGFKSTASFVFWILDENAQKKNAKVVGQGGSNEFPRGGSIGFGDYIKQSDLTDSLLPGGNLTLVFEITVYFEGKTLSGFKDLDKNYFLRQDQGQKQVCDHLGQVLTEKEFSDVDVHCDEMVFPCHQVILAARSPVFRAMLQAERKEKQTRKIVLEDTNPEIVTEMLTFIYTGDIPNEKLDAIACDLLGISDKYQLDYLKRMCEDKLCSTLKVDNSLEYLVLGDLHNASKLKKTALDLIAKNMSKIVDTDFYKDLLIHRPLLAWEVSKVKVQVDDV